MSEEKASFEIAENHLRYFLQSAIENDYFAFHEKLPVVGGGKINCYTQNWINIFS